MARLYDPEVDESYHPDDTPRLYLSDQQVRATMAKLPPTSDPAELEARTILELVETEHRLVLRQESTRTTASHRIEDYRIRHGSWPWSSESARRFYELLGN